MDGSCTPSPALRPSRWQYENFNSASVDPLHGHHLGSLPHRLDMDWLAASELIATDEAANALHGSR